MPSRKMPSRELPSRELPSGKMPSGKMPSGKMPSGKMPSGKMPSGKMPSGKMPSGKMPSGFDFTQAFAEAQRCLLCHDAPCSAGCPADTDPGAFIRKLRFSNLTGAARTIKENNALGGACGVLCPTAELCEKECSATAIDRPIRIGMIQRFLVESAWASGFSPLSVAEGGFDRGGDQEKGKVAVVGGGPAGLSCAAELAQAGHPVTVFEARERAGGVLAYGVPSYRFAAEFLERELDDIRHLGVELKTSSPIDAEAGAEALLEQGFDAVFLGPGCWEPIPLFDQQETLPGHWRCAEFLVATRSDAAGLERAVCDKTVVVLGGGSVATDCAGAALRLGARDVYLAYRRSYAQMPAEEDERIESLRSGVHFLLLNQPVGYTRDGDGALAGVTMRRTRLGEADDSGRRRPLEIDGSDWTLEADVVVEALGYRPAAEAASWYPSIERREDGRVVVDVETGMTSKPGIFAGGDIVRGPALVVKAVQDGKVAARAIELYLAEVRS